MREKREHSCHNDRRGVQRRPVEWEGKREAGDTPCPQHTYTGPWELVDALVGRARDMGPLKGLMDRAVSYGAMRLQWVGLVEGRVTAYWQKKKLSV